MSKVNVSGRFHLMLYNGEDSSILGILGIFNFRQFYERAIILFKNIMPHKPGGKIKSKSCLILLFEM
jgi:hypothetical protein